MSTTIFKYRLDGGTNTIEMPQGARILSLALQRGVPHVWALVDQKMPTVLRTIRVYGTGHDMPDDPGHFIGTFLIRDDSFVFHAFDCGET
jgi:hypothetical protein